MAMLKIDEARRANPAYHRCKMLLQIHDELVFEVDDTCKDDFIRTVLDCTELVMDDFAVPLQVTVFVPAAPPPFTSLGLTCGSVFLAT
jgi:DNA polymerase I-like protein with 3'-5' exonuclease and polymerase domains